MPRRPILVCIFSLIPGAFLLLGCSRAPEAIEIAGDTTGTTYSVKVASPPSAVDEVALHAAIDDVLGLIDRTMSGYREDSEISRFNASRTTDWFAVSPELATIVLAAGEVS